MVGSRIGFALDLSTNAKNGLGLIWVCVEVKFWGLFMEFFWWKKRGGRRKNDGQRRRMDDTMKDRVLFRQNRERERERERVLMWVGVGRLNNNNKNE